MDFPEFGCLYGVVGSSDDYPHEGRTYATIEEAKAGLLSHLQTVLDSSLEIFLSLQFALRDEIKTMPYISPDVEE